jgi:hypothetical protein
MAGWQATKGSRKSQSLPRSYARRPYGRPRAEENPVPKITAREKMETWRVKCIGELVQLKTRAGAVVQEVKRLRADAKRVVGNTTSAASKISTSLLDSIEERRNDVHRALVKELGAAEADALIDTDEYPDTSEDDEHDEESASLLEEIPSLDPEDLGDQAIETLESLEEGINEMLTFLRELK